jgi:DNA-binding transcriptional ArsR family regulator
MVKFLFNLQEVKKAQLTLRAINNKMRVKIIELLVDKKTMNVTQIYVALKIEQSVASQHLAILRKTGIVKTERSGKAISYYIDYDRVDQIIASYELMDM